MSTDSPFRNRRLEEVDPDIARAIKREADREARTLELIASENFVSEAVLEALGPVVANLYGGCDPANRWYGGRQGEGQDKRGQCGARGSGGSGVTRARGQIG